MRAERSSSYPSYGYVPRHAEERTSPAYIPKLLNQSSAACLGISGRPGHCLTHFTPQELSAQIRTVAFKKLRDRDAACRQIVAAASKRRTIALPDGTEGSKWEWKFLITGRHVCASCFAQVYGLGRKSLQRIKREIDFQAAGGNLGTMRQHGRTGFEYPSDRAIFIQA